MVRFLLLFLLLQAVLFGVEILQPVQQAVILPWTNVLAVISGWLMSFFDENVLIAGKVISSQTSDFAVSIEPGCNGVEAMIILLAAILAFPAPWGYKLKGLLWGFIAIQGMNLIRIISLFYLGQWSKELFDWAHLYIWQALIMLDALVVFLIWIRYLPGDKADPGVGSADANATDVTGAVV